MSDTLIFQPSASRPPPHRLKSEPFHDHLPGRRYWWHFNLQQYINMWFKVRLIFELSSVFEFQPSTVELLFFPHYNNPITPVQFSPICLFFFFFISPSAKTLPQQSQKGQMTVDFTLVRWNMTQHDKIQPDVMSAPWLSLEWNILTSPVIAEWMRRRSGDGKCRGNRWLNLFYCFHINLRVPCPN